MWVMVDVEATGPVPGLFSMFWFGAVIVDPGLKYSFEGKLCPLEFGGFEGGPDNNRGLQLAGKTLADIADWPQPHETMLVFDQWLRHQAEMRGDSRIMLVSDNNGYDAMYMAWYFHRFLGRNPFGHSSTNLGSLYKGLVKNMFQNFKHLRQTKHTHNPVDDAMGNAEAFLTMANTMGLKAGF